MKRSSSIEMLIFKLVRVDKRSILFHSVYDGIINVTRTVDFGFIHDLLFRPIHIMNVDPTTIVMTVVDELYVVA